MASSYPTIYQHRTQVCFLSLLEEHQWLLVDLGRTVLFSTSQSPQPLTQAQLLTTLVSRYGGLHTDWVLNPVTDGFLVKAPIWMFQDDLHLDLDFWEALHVSILPWQAMDTS